MPTFITLLVSLVVTLLVEVPICLILTDKKSKKDIGFFVLINVLTNIPINVALEFVFLFYGDSYIYLLFFMALEIIVIIIESIAFSRRLKDKKYGTLVGLMANFPTIVASFLLAINIHRAIIKFVIILVVEIVYIGLTYLLRVFFIKKGILNHDQEQ